MEEKVEQLLIECKYLKKKLIQVIFVNISILLFELFCIWNCFQIKTNGFKLLSKEFCLFVVIFATIVGLKAFVNVLKQTKQYFKISLIKEILENK